MILGWVICAEGGGELKKNKIRKEKKRYLIEKKEPQTARPC